MPSASVFAFAAGSSVVVQDLLSRRQEVLSGVASPVACMAVAPSGTILAFSGWALDEFGRAPISVWRRVSGEWVHLGNLYYHEIPVRCLAFSADGRYLVSVSTADSTSDTDGAAGAAGDADGDAAAAKRTAAAGTVDADVCVWDVDGGCVAADTVLAVPAGAVPGAATVCQAEWASWSVAPPPALQRQASADTVATEGHQDFVMEFVTIGGTSLVRWRYNPETSSLRANTLAIRTDVRAGG